MAETERVVAEEVRRIPPVVTSRTYEILWTFLTGVGVGVLVYLVAYLLNRFVFSVMLCQNEGAAGCANVEFYSMAVAMIVGALSGLISLTMMQVFRPLLVVLAATISLWGIEALISGMAWYWGVLIIAVLFGLAYALFAWLARIRSFVLATIIIVVVTVIVRLVAMS